jgi:CheY-like chemotaxis protein
MIEFSLRTLCNKLNKDLAESLGDKNIIKLSIDVQLSDRFSGNPDQLAESVKKIAILVANALVNGVVTIELTKKKELDSIVTLHVEVSGIGLFRNPYSKEEYEKHFTGFPYPVLSKLSDTKVTLSFNLDLKQSGTTKKGNNHKFDKKRVLIAEDNEINAMVFSSFLESWGCEVTHVVNGAEAVAEAQEDRYDIILMDIYMPILNGIDAIHKIREMNTTVPVIVLTASTLEEDTRKAMAAGANGYLLKPISSTELFQSLKKYV